ncbi:transposase [Ferrimonas lipolytica]|uniref:Transposase n=1 Tax=Ferrimonas lipolytica TaxID=2724191 RepID=A0A6H1UEU7_9GAMM|nr:transposase [Ferrimonas lipolytica]
MWTTFLRDITLLVDNVLGAGSFIANQDYDSKALRQHIDDSASKLVISKRNYDSNINKERVGWCWYKYRHLVENAFAQVKHFRSVATRYEKLVRNHASMVTLAFIIRLA